MGRYRTYKKRANYRRRSQRGGNTGGSHLGDNAKNFLDGISTNLAEDVSEKVTNRIFEKLGQMFSTAAVSENEEREDDEPSQMEREDDEPSQMEREDDEPSQMEREDEEPSQAEREEEEPSRMEEPLANEPSTEGAESSSTEGTKSNSPDNAPPSPFNQEKIQPDSKPESEIPVQEVPSTNGEGNPNPIPQNDIKKGGRKSHRRHLKYNIRRSYRRYRR
jgi:hypothetical protein